MEELLLEELRMEECRRAAFKSWSAVEIGRLGRRRRRPTRWTWTTTLRPVLGGDSGEVQARVGGSPRSSRSCAHGLERTSPSLPLSAPLSLLQRALSPGLSRATLPVVLPSPPPFFSCSNGRFRPGCLAPILPAFPPSALFLRSPSSLILLSFPSSASPSPFFARCALSPRFPESPPVLTCMPLIFCFIHAALCCGRGLWRLRVVCTCDRAEPRAATTEREHRRGCATAASHGRQRFRRWPENASAGQHRAPAGTQSVRLRAYAGRTGVHHRHGHAYEHGHERRCLAP